MKSFIQGADGRVSITNGDDFYSDSAENFASDYGQSAPPTPEGYTGRIYVEGVKHALTTKDSQKPQQAAWQVGDDVIALCSSFIAKQENRLNPPKSVSRQKELAIKEINMIAEHARGKFSTTGSGQAVTYAEKEKDALSYIAAGYPTGQIAGYPWIDAERQALGITGKAAADSIAAAAANSRNSYISIEMVRKQHIKVIEGKSTKNTIETAKATAHEALDALWV